VKRAVIISPFSDLSSIGPRVLSSCLKQAGFPTRKLFLHFPQEKGGVSPGLFLYPESVLEKVGELCSDSLFVGVSLMTNYFDRVVQLSRFLRTQVGVPVVFGGIHATLMPKECAEFADYVCVGEGEGVIVDVARAFLEGKEPTQVANIAYIRDGEFIQNPVRALVQNLDDIPFPDYSLDDDYVLMDGDLHRMDKKDVERLITSAAPGEKSAQEGPYYMTMMTRGCRYACTYCCNHRLFRLYGRRGFIRRRSVENLIEELLWVRKNLPFVEFVVLTDDSFFDCDESRIREFCQAYKEKIGLPFLSLGTPFGINDEKLRMMVDAGMIYVQVGIQTGSERIRKMYKRPFSNEEIISIADMLAKYVPRMLPPRYDIIIDNPMEEDKDVVDSIRLLLKLKKPYFIQYFPLCLFPGTDLADRAAKAGIITNWKEQVYRKQVFHKRRTYLNFVLNLFNSPAPKFILRLLITRPALFLLNRPYFGRLLRLVLRSTSLVRVCLTVGR